MKLSDYFLRYKYDAVRAENSSMQKQAVTSAALKFDDILAARQADQKEPAAGPSRGLEISDYLASPIPARTIGPPGVLKEEVAAKETPQSKAEADANTAQKLDANPVHVQRSPVLKPNPSVSLQSEEIAKNAAREKIDRSIQTAAVKYNLPPRLIRGVIQAESDFQPNAVSSAGAKGLMQLMPGTASDLGVTSPFDIDQNIDGGSRYLKKMLDMFHGDIKKALAAYNAGPGTVKRYQGIPPYRETIHYVRKVLNLAGKMG
jgi:soluble lytic murein transglycosylase-like protein